MDPPAPDWRKTLPAPLPGPFILDLIPSVDIQSHDSSLDARYRRIHTPYTSSFQLDVLALLSDIDKLSSADWLRKISHADQKTQDEQTARRTAIKRERSNIAIEDIQDHKKAVEESFERVTDKIAGYEVAEEYILMPQRKNSYILATGDEITGKEYVTEGTESTVVDRCRIMDEIYEYTKQKCEDTLLIELGDDGHAYYGQARLLYKFRKK